ncbi:transcriptional regulator [Micromonospora craterilacus]|uniref:Transcriptional regulator n=1 Tax=Micromonospora craterilacus TaxID=1655439 RepID=A0A2W2DYM9_9ACTN|nr:BTAD domain-containing putative transcriptional regulator [Micromonospora craterilacus]PZG09389.1 transcriptional regulator [Micromonospora craterilacus]
MNRTEIEPRIEILGPVRATIRGREVDLGPPKQRAVLALLALRAGGHVPLDDLVVVLWPGQPPTRAASLVHTYVARLRHALEPDTPRRRRTNVIASVQGGYRLAVGDDQLDLFTFRAGIREAAARREAGEADSAFARYGETLEQWRDPQLGDLAALLVEPDDIGPLRQEFLVAALDYIGLGLELDRPDSVLPLTERLAQTEPLNERVQARVLQALTRIGQRAWAIERYADVRMRLKLDLGVDPGPELTAAYREVLDAEAAPPPPGPGRGGVQQPPWRGPAPVVDELIGRSADLAAVCDLLGEFRMVSLTGPAGVGKSALGLAAAEELRERFADGVVVVDLASVRTGPELTRTTAAVVEEPESWHAGASMPLAHRLHDRKLLLILDNAELVTDDAADLVDDVLRGCPQVTVLLASRELLGLPYEAVYPVRPLGVEADRGPSAAPALQLFARRAAQVQPGFRLTDANLEAVTSVCRALDGLPLAIELAAACLRTQRLDALVDVVEDPLRRIQPPRRGLPSHHRSLHAAVNRSIELLGPAERRCFKALGAVPAEFGLETAAVAGRAVAGGPETLRVLLDRLVDKSVLEVMHGSSGRRYRMLGTVHALARQLLHEHGVDAGPPAGRCGCGCGCGCHAGR